MGNEENTKNMLEQILPGIFQIKVPFPGNPLKDINIYVIKGKNKSLMVDNGIDLPATRQELYDDIAKIGLDLKHADFFITHSPDHCSNTPVLAGPESEIYIGRADVEMLSYGSSAMQERHARRNVILGVPEGNFFTEGNAFKPVHPMYELTVRRGWKFSTPEDGEMIQAGNYSFTCIETPGHSPGHLCLYEQKHKMLLCGDHILQKVTPVILPTAENDNPLKQYLASLEKIKKLDIALALPAHRGIISNVKERIRGIQHHHEIRLQEILDIIDQKKLTAYQIASAMHWDVSYKSWEAFPIWQRMIATSEAESHLRFLVAEKKISREIEIQPWLYSRA
jgi:glyoxylase-like metal-dependent hydrolase (beta-lactamase superfamily II)